MDVSDLAMEAAALLGGYGVAVGKEVADKTKSAVAQRLYEVIEQRLSRRGSDARALANLVQEPANHRHREVVAAALDDAVREDPQFENNLRRAVHEVRIRNSPNIQTATNMAPISGGQLIANVGPGASLNDAVVNNQGTIDQSTYTTTYDRRRTTHKRGISGLWLVVIVVVVGLVVIGGTSYLIVSINHPAWIEELFGSSPDEGHPASEVGGRGTDGNLVFATNPYEAVRRVYDYIAQGAPDQVCLSFKDRGQQFASNMGYPDCEQAVRGLAGQVTDRNAYAESMPSATATPVSGDSVRISSCEDNIGDGIQGGPPLGVFTVEEIPGSKGRQWIITGHETETRQCGA